VIGISIFGPGGVWVAEYCCRLSQLRLTSCGCTHPDSACKDNCGQRYEWHLVPFQGSAMSTSLAVAYPSNPSIITSVQLAATVTTNWGMTPTGMLTFYDGTTELGQSALSGTSNSVTFTAGNLIAGVHNLSAVYSGDSNNLPSAAAQAPINVTPLLASSTSLASSATSVTVGQKLAFAMGLYNLGT